MIELVWIVKAEVDDNFVYVTGSVSRRIAKLVFNQSDEAVIYLTRASSLYDAHSTMSTTA